MDDENAEKSPTLTEMRLAEMDPTKILKNLRETRERSEKKRKQAK